ncbi:MAG: hypothetical protein WA418_22105 [Bradyrhizobium sp.]
MPSPPPNQRRAAFVMLTVVVLGNIAAIIAWPAHCATSPHLTIGSTIWIAGCNAR